MTGCCYTMDLNEFILADRSYIKCFGSQAQLAKLGCKILCQYYDIQEAYGKIFLKKEGEYCQYPLTDRANEGGLFNIPLMFWGNIVAMAQGMSWYRQYFDFLTSAHLPSATAMSQTQMLRAVQNWLQVQFSFPFQMFFSLCIRIRNVVGVWLRTLPPRRQQSESFVLLPPLFKRKLEIAPRGVIQISNEIVNKSL